LTASKSDARADISTSGGADRLRHIWGSALADALHIGHSVSMGREERVRLDREEWERAGAFDPATRVQARGLFKRGFSFANMWTGQLLIDSEIVGEFSRRVPHDVVFFAGDHLTRHRSRPIRPCFRVVTLVSSDDSVVLVARHVPPPSARSFGWVIHAEALISPALRHHVELLALFSFRQFSEEGSLGWPRDLRSA
jgi:hypothetical protein